MSTPSLNQSEPCRSFMQLPLSEAMQSNLNALGYHELTPIQAQCLPEIINKKDVIAQAKTGSGKTATFGIGLLHSLKPQIFQTQALVICPTRELTEQVCNELRRLARAVPNTKIITLCGGKAMAGQLASLEKNPHIVVGTPGRLLQHLEKNTLDVSQLATLVLDEADRMLDMGFLNDIEQVIAKTPSSRQTLLFSATYPDDIKKVSRSVQKNPVDIKVESVHQETQIQQHFYALKTHSKEQALLAVLKHYQPTSAVVFCNRKQQCDDLTQFLGQNGISAKSLHGDLEQNDRDRVLVQFTNNSCRILVATDVAARGLDIKELPLVINMDLPHEPEVYLHRIGRTGRAGSVGTAVSLFEPADTPKVIAIENVSKQALPINDLSTLNAAQPFNSDATMVTLCINGGRKDKLRAGDILGALTAKQTIAGDAIGKIDRFDRLTYVAVDRAVRDQALKLLNNGKVKGRQFKARVVK